MSLARYISMSQMVSRVLFFGDKCMRLMLKFQKGTKMEWNKVYMFLFWFVCLFWLFFFLGGGEHQVPEHSFDIEIRIYKGRLEIT